jgi:hypothetical protein
MARQLKLAAAASPTDKIRAGMEPLIDRPPVQVIPARMPVDVQTHVLQPGPTPSPTLVDKLQDLAVKLAIEEKRGFCAGCWHESVCAGDNKFQARQDCKCAAKVTGAVPPEPLCNSCLNSKGCQKIPTGGRTVCGEYTEIQF